MFARRNPSFGCGANVLKTAPSRTQFCVGAFSTICRIATSLNLGSGSGVEERGGGCGGGGGSGVDVRDVGGVCDGCCESGRVCACVGCSGPRGGGIVVGVRDGSSVNRAFQA